MVQNPDIIIAGAGLSGLLMAWRCLDVNPELSILMIEASDKIAGDHTWSFNLSDVPDYLHDWLKPFIVYQWPRYDVKFPKRERTLEIPYCTGNSDSLRTCVAPYIENGRLKVMLGTKVTALTAFSVTLENGDVLKAHCVLDARGFQPNKNVFLGYQKFVGKTIRTQKPHGLINPIIMDATVKQLGGYRFVYCLPFSDHEVLVEDTYYTDGPELSESEIAGRVDGYIQAQGWEEYEVVRQEKGVLPITLGIDKAELNNCDVTIGIRGGFYHAVTGYSFPDAVKLADYLSWDIQGDRETSSSLAIDGAPHFLRWSKFPKESFLRLLNRMLFRACEPEKRYKVLQRFYGLSEGLIKRFYAGKLTLTDKARILIGKPPVPIHKALYNFSEKAFIERERERRQRDSL
ncbi:lycopene beta-cyclase [Litorimonas taeanensis]|uniref:Lycopene beta-cyclase n=1 Tax=Litorimonas taeanensis TaxID=568099 RepID=A0A420WJH6_9PROT|nr:lycopene beta-cyclase CrtY [Litorimonas taeanensis]RKQ71089.1 lycopene beta-cyclase [Litorimonas taeanensis]